MGWEGLQWTGVKYLHHGTTFRAWRSILKTGIIPGYVDQSQRDRRQKGSQRLEAFYSSSTYVHIACSTVQVQALQERGGARDRHGACREIWLQILALCTGRLMTEDVVPAAAVLAVRRVTGHREA
eukprot:3501591-Pyramimonas_sp.AAC.1